MNKQSCLNDAVEIIKEIGRGGVTLDYTATIDRLYRKLVELQEDVDRG